MPLAVAGDLEHLPFADGVFGAVVCVGSVLNYVSAMEALAELGRVLKGSGFLILHFETSDSLEHLGSRAWRKDAHLLRTVNNGRPDLVWIYSRKYVRRTLNELGLRVLAEQPFHIASAGLLRIGLSQEMAAVGARLDRYLGFAGAMSDDLILIAQKA